MLLENRGEPAVSYEFPFLAEKLSQRLFPFISFFRTWTTMLVRHPTYPRVFLNTQPLEYLDIFKVRSV